MCLCVCLVGGYLVSNCNNKKVELGKVSEDTITLWDYAGWNLSSVGLGRKTLGLRKCTQCYQYCGKRETINIGA